MQQNNAYVGTWPMADKWGKGYLKNYLGTNGYYTKINKNLIHTSDRNHSHMNEIVKWKAKL